MEVSKAELAPLWDKYKRIAQKAAKRFESPHYEQEDLLQECFIIFMRALKEYEPGVGCSFTTYFYNRVQWRLYRLIYGKDGKEGLKIKEVCVLDAPVKSDDEEKLTMSDSIPDPEAEFADDVIDHVAISSLWELCRFELETYKGEKDERSGMMYNVIVDKYRFGITDEEAAKKHGVPVQLIGEEHRRAMKCLRRSRKLYELYCDVIGESIFHGGIGTFKATGSSSVEWAVLERERIRELQELENDKLYPKIKYIEHTEY